MSSNTRLQYLATAVALAALAACGGGGGGGSNPSTPTATPSTTPTTAPTTAPTTTPTTSPTTPGTSKFTQSQTWTFDLPASGDVCYDFDAGAQTADCTGSVWDVKVVGAGRTASLFTNSGPSGTGQGAALGTPFTYTWDQLLTYTDATKDATGVSVPGVAWIADKASSVFSGNNAIQSAAFEYGVDGGHQLSPNFCTFLLTSNSASTDITGAAGTVYALQMTGYYGSPTGTTSGWPSFRFVNTANPSQVFSSPNGGVNATNGWVYYNLASNSVSSESGTWHIAFNRYSVKLNGGASGSGTVAGFLSKTPAGFYAANGSPIEAKFSSTSNLTDTLPDLTGSQTGPTAVNKWVKDTIGSQLAPTYTGVYPAALNYGWFSYAPTASAIPGLGQHQLKANEQAATLVRSGAGNSYARMHLTNISYAPANPAYNGQQTWTIKFDVQAAP